MRIEKPTTKNNLANLPRVWAPYKKQPLFSGWKFTQKGNGDGWSKPPYRADDPRRIASLNDPTAWGPLDTVLPKVQAGEFDGATIRLTENGELAAAELDNCLTGKGKVAPWAREIVKRAVSACIYTEYSPGGTGLHFVGTTTGNAAKVFCNERFDFRGERAGIEIFRACRKALTLTGLQYGRGGLKDLRPIDEFIDELADLVARRKAKAAKAAKASSKVGNYNGSGGLEFDDVEQIVENGPAPGTDRSAVFFGIVGSYFGRGWSAERIAEHLEQHPGGIGARYIEQGRLADQVGKCVAKYAAQNRTSAEPQPEAVEAPEQKPARASRLKRKAPAEPEEGAEEDTEEELPPLYSHGDEEDPNEPDDWLIKGLLPVPGRGMVSGRSNIGKSFILIDMAVRIAMPPTDTPALFLGHKVQRAGALVFSAEGGHREMKKRVDTAVRIACGNSDTKLPIKWFTQFPRLRSLGAVHKLSKYIKKAAAQLQHDHGVDIKLIAFDTFGASVGHTKANEANDSSIVQDVMNRLLVLAETFNCHVLVVHHPPKGDEAESSGSGALENNVDTWLCCLGKRHKSGRFSNTRVAIVKNKRGGMVGAQYPYTLHTEEIGKDKDGDAVTTNTVAWLPPSAISDDDDALPAPSDPWTAGLRQGTQHTAALRLKRVMYELLADPERVILAPVSENGAMVRMAPQKAVQTAFFDRTADEEEEQQTRQGKHAEFKRARNRAEDHQLIGIGKVEGKTHLWLCQSPEEDPR